MRVTSTHLEISIVTANLLHRQQLSHPKHDVQWIIDTWAPDIIGCQEAEGYGSVLKKFAGYGFAVGVSGKEDPVLFNQSTLRLVGVTSHFMTKGRAGQDPSRYVTAAHFVTKTDGAHVWYFNTHVNHHIEAAGSDPALNVGPRGTPRPGPQTTDAIHHFKKMAELVKARAIAGDGVALWGGDFNVDIIADMNHPGGTPFLYEIFRNHGLLSAQEELHVNNPGRDIDIIGSCDQDKKVKALRMIRHDVDLYSDHPFIYVEYSIPRGKSSGGAVTPPAEAPGREDLPLPDEVPIPASSEPLDPVLVQPPSTVDHSVCCKKNG